MSKKTKISSEDLVEAVKGVWRKRLFWL